MPWEASEHVGFVPKPYGRVVRRSFVHALPKMGAMCVRCRVVWYLFAVVKGGYFCSVVVMNSMF